jgi:hypothetical protein
VFVGNNAKYVFHLSFFIVDASMSTVIVIMGREKKKSIVDCFIVE